MTGDIINEPDFTVCGANSRADCCRAQKFLGEQQRITTMPAKPDQEALSSPSHPLQAGSRGGRLL
jgi:hypothetical protein